MLSFKLLSSRLLIRHISSVLVAAFLFQDLSYANPEVLKEAFLFPSGLPKLNIPSSIATIEDSWKAPRRHSEPIRYAQGKLREESKKRDPSTTASSQDDILIYLIQDAHTNESAQRNIAKTIDLVLEQSKHQTPFVFLEAGFGDSSLSPLRQYGTVKQRQAIAEKYLKRGYIQGPDYLDLTSDKPFTLWGVEDKELYWKALGHYRYLKDNRPDIHNYLDRVRRTIRTLKPKLYNPSLYLLDEKREEFLKQNLSMTEYMDILLQEQKKLKLPEDLFPNLLKLKAIKQKEQAINFEEASKEQLTAIESLSPEDQTVLKEALNSKGNQTLFLLDSGEHKEEKGFYALLEEKLKDRWASESTGDAEAGRPIRSQRSAVTRERMGLPQRQDPSVRLPNLYDYFSYLHEVKKLDLKALLKEKDDLETILYNLLARSQDERQLVLADKSLGTLKKLFDLTLLSEDLMAIESDPQAFDIVRITGFLNKKIMDLKSYYEDALFLEKDYGEYYRQALEFYRLAKERDQAFIENTLKKLNEEALSGKRQAISNPTAILVTGGFHTDHLKTLLKEQNISYLSITPQVLKETNMKRYEELLLGQQKETSNIETKEKPVHIGLPSARALVLTLPHGPSLSVYRELKSEAMGLGARAANRPIYPSVIKKFLDKRKVEAAGRAIRAYLAKPALKIEESGVLDNPFNANVYIVHSHDAGEAPIKVRVGLERMLKLLEGDGGKTAHFSAGTDNEEEAIAVMDAASKAGLPLTLYMPKYSVTPVVRQQETKAVRVVSLSGSSSKAATQEAQRQAAESQALWIDLNDDEARRIYDEAVHSIRPSLPPYAAVVVGTQTGDMFSSWIEALDGQTQTLVGVRIKGKNKLTDDAAEKITQYSIFMDKVNPKLVDKAQLDTWYMTAIPVSRESALPVALMLGPKNPENPIWQSRDIVLVMGNAGVPLGTDTETLKGINEPADEAALNKVREFLEKDKTNVFSVRQISLETGLDEQDVRKALAHFARLDKIGETMRGFYTVKQHRTFPAATDGAELHVDIYNDKGDPKQRTLSVVHGYLMSSAIARFIVQFCIRHDIRVVVFDLRGHGRSQLRPGKVLSWNPFVMWDYFMERLELLINYVHLTSVGIEQIMQKLKQELKIESFDHFSTSMGSLVSQEFYQNMSEDIDLLVLSTPVLSGEDPKENNKFTRRVNELLSDVIGNFGYLTGIMWFFWKWPRRLRDPIAEFVIGWFLNNLGEVDRTYPMRELKQMLEGVSGEVFHVAYYAMKHFLMKHVQTKHSRWNSDFLVNGIKKRVEKGKNPKILFVLGRKDALVDNARIMKKVEELKERVRSLGLVGYDVDENIVCVVLPSGKHGLMETRLRNLMDLAFRFKFWGEVSPESDKSRLRRILESWFAKDSLTMMIEKVKKDMNVKASLQEGRVVQENDLAALDRLSQGIAQGRVRMDKSFTDFVDRWVVRDTEEDETLERFVLDIARRFQHETRSVTLSSGVKPEELLQFIASQDPVNLDLSSGLVLFPLSVNNSLEMRVTANRARIVQRLVDNPRIRKSISMMVMKSEDEVWLIRHITDIVGTSVTKLKADGELTFVDGLDDGEVLRRAPEAVKNYLSGKSDFSETGRDLRPMIRGGHSHQMAYLMLRALASADPGTADYKVLHPGPQGARLARPKNTVHFPPIALTGSPYGNTKLMSVDTFAEFERMAKAAYKAGEPYIVTWPGGDSYEKFYQLLHEEEYYGRLSPSEWRNVIVLVGDELGPGTQDPGANQRLILSHLGQLPDNYRPTFVPLYDGTIDIANMTPEDFEVLVENYSAKLHQVLQRKKTSHHISTIFSAPGRDGRIGSLLPYSDLVLNRQSTGFAVVAQNEALRMSLTPREYLDADTHEVMVAQYAKRMTHARFRISRPSNWELAVRRTPYNILREVENAQERVIVRATEEALSWQTFTLIGPDGREVEVYVRFGTDPKGPVVFALHGFTGLGTWEMQQAEFPRQYTVVVVPRYHTNDRIDTTSAAGFYSYHAKNLALAITSFADPDFERRIYLSDGSNPDTGDLDKALKHLAAKKPGEIRPIHLVWHSSGNLVVNTFYSEADEYGPILKHITHGDGADPFFVNDVKKATVTLVPFILELIPKVAAAGGLGWGQGMILSALSLPLIFSLPKRLVDVRNAALEIGAPIAINLLSGIISDRFMERSQKEFERILKTEFVDKFLAQALPEIGSEFYDALKMEYRKLLLRHVRLEEEAITRHYKRQTDARAFAAMKKYGLKVQYTTHTKDGLVNSRTVRRMARRLGNLAQIIVFQGREGDDPFTSHLWHMVRFFAWNRLHTDFIDGRVDGFDKNRIRFIRPDDVSSGARAAVVKKGKHFLLVVGVASMLAVVQNPISFTVGLISEFRSISRSQDPENPYDALFLEALESGGIHSTLEVWKSIPPHEWMKANESFRTHAVMFYVLKIDNAQTEQDLEGLSELWKEFDDKLRDKLSPDEYDRVRKAYRNAVRDIFLAWIKAAAATDDREALNLIRSVYFNGANSMELQFTEQGEAIETALNTAGARMAGKENGWWMVDNGLWNSPSTVPDPLSAADASLSSRGRRRRPRDLVTLDEISRGAAPRNDKVGARAATRAGSLKERRTQALDFVTYWLAVGLIAYPLASTILAVLAVKRVFLRKEVVPLQIGRELSGNENKLENMTGQVSPTSEIWFKNWKEILDNPPALSTAQVEQILHFARRLLEINRFSLRAVNPEMAMHQSTYRGLTQYAMSTVQRLLAQVTSDPSISAEDKKELLNDAQSLAAYADYGISAGAAIHHAERVLKKKESYQEAGSSFVHRISSRDRQLFFGELSNVFVVGNEIEKIMGRDDTLYAFEDQTQLRAEFTKYFHGILFDHAGRRTRYENSMIFLKKIGLAVAVIVTFIHAGLIALGLEELTPSTISFFIGHVSIALWLILSLAQLEDPTYHRDRRGLADQRKLIQGSQDALWQHFERTREAARREVDEKSADIAFVLCGKWPGRREKLQTKEFFRIDLPVVWLDNEKAGTAESYFRLFSQMEPAAYKKLQAAYPSLRGKALEELRMIVLVADRPDEEEEAILAPETAIGGDSPWEWAYKNACDTTQMMKREGRTGLTIWTPHGVYVGPKRITGDHTLIGSWKGIADMLLERLSILKPFPGGSPIIQKIFFHFNILRIANSDERKKLGEIYDWENDAIRQMPVFTFNSIISYRDPEKFRQFIAYINGIKRHVEGRRTKQLLSYGLGRLGRLVGAAASYFRSSRILRLADSLILKARDLLGQTVTPHLTRDVLVAHTSTASGEDPNTFLPARERQAEREGQPMSHGQYVYYRGLYKHVGRSNFARNEPFSRYLSPPAKSAFFRVGKTAAQTEDHRRLELLMTSQAAGARMAAKRQPPFGKRRLQSYLSPKGRLRRAFSSDELRSDLRKRGVFINDFVAFYRSRFVSRMEDALKRELLAHYLFADYLSPNSGSPDGRGRHELSKKMILGLLRDRHRSVYESVIDIILLYLVHAEKAGSEHLENRFRDLLTDFSDLDHFAEAIVNGFMRIRAGEAEKDPYIDNQDAVSRVSNFILSINEQKKKQIFQILRSGSLPKAGSVSSGIKGPGGARMAQGFRVAKQNKATRIARPIRGIYAVVHIDEATHRKVAIFRSASEEIHRIDVTRLTDKPGDIETRLKNMLRGLLMSHRKSKDYNVDIIAEEIRRFFTWDRIRNHIDHPLVVLLRQHNNGEYQLRLAEAAFLSHVLTSIDQGLSYFKKLEVSTVMVGESAISLGVEADGSMYPLIDDIVPAGQLVRILFFSRFHETPSETDARAMVEEDGGSFVVKKAIPLGLAIRAALVLDQRRFIEIKTVRLGDVSYYPADLTKIKTNQVRLKAGVKLEMIFYTHRPRRRGFIIGRRISQGERELMGQRIRELRDAGYSLDKQESLTGIDSETLRQVAERIGGTTETTYRNFMKVYWSIEKPESLEVIQKRIARDISILMYKRWIGAEIALPSGLAQKHVNDIGRELAGISVESAKRLRNTIQSLKRRLSLAGEVKALTERLRIFMSEHELTQQRLADLMGVDSNILNRLLRGRLKRPRLTVGKINDYLAKKGESLPSQELVMKNVLDLLDYVSRNNNKDVSDRDIRGSFNRIVGMSAQKTEALEWFAKDELSDLGFSESKYQSLDVKPAAIRVLKLVGDTRAISKLMRQRNRAGARAADASLSSRGRRRRPRDLVTLDEISRGAAPRNDKVGAWMAEVETLGAVPSVTLEYGLRDAGLMDHATEQPAGEFSVTRVHRDQSPLFFNDTLPLLVGPNLPFKHEPFGFEDSQEGVLADNKSSQAAVWRTAGGLSARGRFAYSPRVDEWFGEAPPASKPDNSQATHEAAPGGERGRGRSVDPGSQGSFEGILPSSGAPPESMSPGRLNPVQGTGLYSDRPQVGHSTAEWSDRTLTLFSPQTPQSVTAHFEAVKPTLTTLGARLPAGRQGAADASLSSRGRRRRPRDLVTLDEISRGAAPRNDKVGARMAGLNDAIGELGFLREMAAEIESFSPKFLHSDRARSNLESAVLTLNNIVEIGVAEPGSVEDLRWMVDLVIFHLAVATKEIRKYKRSSPGGSYTLRRTNAFFGAVKVWHRQLKRFKEALETGARAAERPKVQVSSSDPLNSSDSNSPVISSFLPPASSFSLSFQGARAAIKERVKREEGRGKKKGENKNATAFRESESLAVGHDAGRGNLPGNLEVSKGRTIWFDGSTAPGGRLDPRQYLGRQRQEPQEGIRPVSLHGPWLSLRNRNPYSTFAQTELSYSSSEGESFNPLKRNLSYAYWTNSLSSIIFSSRLSPSISPLDAKGVAGARMSVTDEDLKRSLGEAAQYAELNRLNSVEINVGSYLTFSWPREKFQAVADVASEMTSYFKAHHIATESIALFENTLVIRASSDARLNWSADDRAKIEVIEEVIDGIDDEIRNERPEYFEARQGEWSYVHTWSIPGVDTIHDFEEKGLMGPGQIFGDIGGGVGVMAAFAAALTKVGKIVLFEKDSYLAAKGKKAIDVLHERGVLDKNKIEWIVGDWHDHADRIRELDAVYIYPPLHEYGFEVWSDTVLTYMRPGAYLRDAIYSEKNGWGLAGARLAQFGVEQTPVLVSVAATVAGGTPAPVIFNAPIPVSPVLKPTAQSLSAAREFFAQVAQTTPVQINGARLALNQPVGNRRDESADYIYSIEERGSVLIATSQTTTLHIVRNHSKQRRGKMSAKRPNISDLRLMEDTLNKDIHGDLISVAENGKIKILSWDVDRFSNGSFDSQWLAYLDEFIEAKESYLKNAVIQVFSLSQDQARVDRAMQHAQAKVLAERGWLFEELSEELKLALKDQTAVKVDAIAVSDKGKPAAGIPTDGRTLPFRSLTDRDVPAVRADLELAYAVGNADLESPEDLGRLVKVWKVLANADIDPQTLREIIENRAVWEILVKFALKPLAAADWDLAERYLKYRLQVDRAA